MKIAGLILAKLKRDTGSISPMSHFLSIKGGVINIQAGFHAKFVHPRIALLYTSRR